MNKSRNISDNLERFNDNDFKTIVGKFSEWLGISKEVILSKYDKQMEIAKTEYKAAERLLVQRIIKELEKRVRKLDAKVSKTGMHPKDMPNEIKFDIKNWKEYERYSSFIKKDKHSQQAAFDETMKKYGLTGVVDLDYWCGQSDNYILVSFEITDRNLLISYDNITY